jgi:hypothetical protein
MKGFPALLSTGAGGGEGVESRDRREEKGADRGAEKRKGKRDRE